MRGLSLVAGIALLAASNAAAVTLQIARPHIDVLGMAEIAVRCNGIDRQACTFVQTRLTSSCAAARDAWHPVTLVQIDAHVLTSQAGLLTHEFSHLADIRKALATRAAAIESHAFSSELECLGFILETDSSMKVALLEIESDSGRLRDPVTAFSAATPLANEVANAAADPR